MTGNDDSDGPSRTLTTVERSLDVVRALELLDGAGITELASHLDISKSMAYHHIATLYDQGMLVKNGNQYELGLQFLLLGEYVRNQHVLYRHGREEIEELADSTGEYAHLFTEQHGSGMNLYKVKGQNAVGDEYQNSKLQHPDYLHSTATGKAILAFLPRDRVNHILDRHGLPRQTPHTITSREDLFEELAEVREQGYAYNDEEEVVGLRAVGAPIIGPEDEVLGSLSVSSPTSRLKGKAYHETIPEKVMNTANLIEVNVNMSVRDLKQGSDD